MGNAKQMCLHDATHARSKQQLADLRASILEDQLQTCTHGKASGRRGCHKVLYLSLG